MLARWTVWNAHVIVYNQREHSADLKIMPENLNGIKIPIEEFNKLLFYYNFECIYFLLR